MHCDLHLTDITSEQLGRVAAVMAERQDRLLWAERTTLFRAGWAWDMADGWVSPDGERLTEADVEQRGRLRCAATSKPGESACWGQREAQAGEPETSADAAPAPSEPTARDAVAGMLLRRGYPATAKALLTDSWTPAQAISSLKRPPVSDDDAACIAALEALDRGDLRGARDHVDLMSAIERLTRERERLTLERDAALSARDATRDALDEARAEVAALREENERLSDPPIVKELLALRREHQTDRDDEPADRAVLATVAELLGLTPGPMDPPRQDETVEQIRSRADWHTARGEYSEATKLLGYAGGLREGERRTKAKAAELFDSWTRRRAAAEKRVRDCASTERLIWKERRAVLVSCMTDLRRAFGTEPTDDQPPPGGEPAPEAVVADRATTAHVESEHPADAAQQPAEPETPERDPETHTVFADDDVSITAPATMSLGEVWRALTSSPALRMCHESAIERAHADGIVEGLKRAEANVATADRQPHMNRAALLALAEEWEGAVACSATKAADAYASCATDLRRLLDAPRGPGGGEREAASSACAEGSPEHIASMRSTIRGLRDQLDQRMREIATLQSKLRKARAERAAAVAVPGDAPDREALGREVHAVARQRADDVDHDTACNIGERLFSMGVEHERRAWEECTGYRRPEDAGELQRSLVKRLREIEGRAGARIYPIAPGR